jgi:hypothetical protein
MRNIDSSAAASLLVQSACLAQQTQEAESIFFIWLLSRTAGLSAFPADQAITLPPKCKPIFEMIRVILRDRNGCKLYPLFYSENLASSPPQLTLSANTAKTIASLMEQIDLSVLSVHEPPVHVWEAIVKLYARNKSWISCQAALTFLGKKSFSGRRWLPCCVTDYPAAPSPTLMHSTSLHSHSESSAIPQLSEEIYHYTIKSLADAKLFREALTVLERMKTTTGRSPPLGTM